MRIVALCTNSVLVSGIGATLERRPGVRVLRMDPCLPEGERYLGDLIPDVAIVDLSTIHSEPISWLRQYPGLLLIGVDLNSNELLVLSGEPTRPLTLENLVQVIEAGEMEVRSGGQERASP